MTFHPRFAACAALLLWLGVVSPGRAVDEIKPPFGLHWGETTTRLEALLKGAKATVVERRTVDGREGWEVQGILPNDLQRSVFYFLGGELVEVELQYKTEGWDDEKYAKFIADVRARLEVKYGKGQLIASKEEPLGEVLQKIVGWKWNQNNTAIELVDFSAQNSAQLFRTLSVHYKAN